jgi:hypothetical protein
LEIKLFGPYNKNMVNTLKKNLKEVHPLPPVGERNNPVSATVDASWCYDKAVLCPPQAFPGAEVEIRFLSSELTHA